MNIEVAAYVKAYLWHNTKLGLIESVHERERLIQWCPRSLPVSKKPSHEKRTPSVMRLAILQMRMCSRKLNGLK